MGMIKVHHCKEELKMSKLSKSQIKKEMRLLYPAPAPQRKEQFLRELSYPQSSPLETIAVQIGYIRKFVWILSLLLITSALAFGNSYWQQAEDYGMLWCVSAVTPLLAALAVTETFRSAAYGMAELEMSAKHNLQQILLIRMGAIGGVDFLLIMAALPFLVKKEQISMFRGAVYLMAPWLCTCVLAFQIEKYAKGRDSIWYCCALGLFFSGISLGTENFQETVYGNEAFYLWLIVFFVFAAVLANQIWQICHQAEKWNRNLYLAR
jgi:hypothetical protein